MSAKKDELIDKGYCLFQNVLSPELLAQLKADSARLADARLQEDLKVNRSTGSMIDLTELEQCVDLVALPAALDALKSMGYDDPRFTSGYVISKPAKSPPLFWHHDWACWGDPGAFDAVPQQLFLMYYLVDTTPENGCLRVLPGSHVHENPLHRELSEAHSQELSAAKNLDRVEFSSRPDEVDVCVKAGDLVIGDSRILHASHSNDSDARRTVLTLWFHPDMAALDEGTQGYIKGLASKVPEHWTAEKQQLFKKILATYEGDVPALPWNRSRPTRQVPA